MELEEVSSFPRNLFVFLSIYVPGKSKVLFWSNEQFPSMKLFNQEKQTELSCLRFVLKPVGYWYFLKRVVIGKSDFETPITILRLD